MGLGNSLGFEFIKPYNDTDGLFTLQPGGMVLELAGRTVYFAARRHGA